ncbi:MAG: T9SS type A sorting domain-containing protein, partial [Flavobacteriales bacterium]|nr:T9SS type A sorting domain-containing protein [Flavobacteriales bacterium]
EEVSVLEDILEEINVVPNPYYAYSQYETNKLDNRIKIVNLPEECTVRIYNLSGTLIRTYNKANPLTYVDWDLKNEVNVPIASGVYIIHVDVPGVGQTIRKWFGVMRPIDLDSF